MSFFRCSANVNTSFVSLLINESVATNDSERGIYLLEHAATNETLDIEPQIRNNNTVVRCRACDNDIDCWLSDPATLIITTNGTESVACDTLCIVLASVLSPIAFAAIIAAILGLVVVCRLR